jgi:hypothetical protein
MTPKSLPLRSPEILRLDSHGEVLVVRAVSGIDHTDQHLHIEYMDAVWADEYDSHGVGWYAWRDYCLYGNPDDVRQRYVRIPNQPGQPCSVLAGKETWRPYRKVLRYGNSEIGVQYKADAAKVPTELANKLWTIARNGKWRSSTSMPPALSRFPSLHIVSVECRRVNTIKTAEAFATGIDVDERLCGHAEECRLDTWPGVGAYRDDESSEAGGKPWGECTCVLDRFREDWNLRNPRAQFSEGWAWCLKIRKE